ncbi:MAG: nucleotidyltransferase domain-containing protein [Pseudomonadales bacterium]
MNESSRMSIADTLFTKTQQRLLGLLFTNPERSFYLREIFNRTRVGRGAITRELNKLTSSGLVVMSEQGNQNHYQANPGSPIFDELVSISVKTFGLVDVIRRTLAPHFNQIEFAAVYGSMAKQTAHAKSDIDLLIISDTLSSVELIKPMLTAEAELGRTINITHYTVDEFHRKKDSSFLKRITKQPMLLVKDW